MADVQKMLEALECHFKPLGEENCSECQYECRGATFTKVQHRLCMDLVEFLKEQQPRVLDISEFEPFSPMLVWLEDVDKEYVIPAMYFSATHGRIGFKLARDTPADKIYPLKREYNKRWRAWTKKPTNEQRKVTAWN